MQAMHMETSRRTSTVCHVRQLETGCCTEDLDQVQQSSIVTLGPASESESPSLSQISVSSRALVSFQSDILYVSDNTLLQYVWSRAVHRQESQFEMPHQIVHRLGASLGLAVSGPAPWPADGMLQRPQCCLPPPAAPGRDRPPNWSRKAMELLHTLADHYTASIREREKRISLFVQPQVSWMCQGM